MTSKQSVLDLEVGFVSCLCVGEKKWWEYNQSLVVLQVREWD